MKENEVKQLFQECVEKLKELGYNVPEVRLNTKWVAMKTFGRCASIKDGSFLIEISKIHWEHAPYEAVKNTIVHELTHAIDRNIHSHGPIWKKLADEVGPQFDTVITRLSVASIEENEYKKTKAIATLTCDSCGQVYYLYRRVGAYKTNGEGYHCKSCGSGSKFLFEKIK